MGVSRNAVVELNLTANIISIAIGLQIYMGSQGAFHSTNNSGNFKIETSGPEISWEGFQLNPKSF